MFLVNHIRAHSRSIPCRDILCGALPISKILPACFFVLFMVLGATNFAHAAQKNHSVQKRVALVIGNAKYTGLKTLDNPYHDARAMKDILAKSGFEVVWGVDLGKQAFESLIQTFYKKAKGADVVLLFYAGHGFEVKGKNYLIPIDAQPPVNVQEAEGFLQKTISFNDFAEKMGDLAAVKLIFLDACRNDPFQTTTSNGSTRRSVSLPGMRSNGFSSMDAKDGTFILFSTKMGKTAYDGIPAQRGSGIIKKHSPFAEALLYYIQQPGLELVRIGKKVTNQVITKTKKVYPENPQTPWRVASFSGDFYFTPKDNRIEPNRLEPEITPKENKASRPKARRKPKASRTRIKKKKPKIKRASRPKASRPKARRKPKASRTRIKKKKPKVNRASRPKKKSRKKRVLKRSPKKRRAPTRNRRKRNNGGSPTSSGFIGLG